MADEKRATPRYLAIGRIFGAHGIRGEVKVESLTDFPERFAAGTRLHMGSGTEDPEAQPVEITAARGHKGAMLVKLDVVPDRTAAELLRGLYLMIPESEAMPLGEHENYAHDLIGLRVETAQGEVLGELAEILFTGANDVYVVRGPGGELLLPALRDVVLTVDLAAGKMVVALPDGLREAESADLP